MRIAIAGGPKTGKTTLAGEGARHTDDLKSAGWSEASLAVSYWFDDPGPWTIEGVAVPRALRKWLSRNPEGRPCDRVVWLFEPKIPLSDGQTRMRKGCETVWLEIWPELVTRGVEIVIGDKGA